MQPNALRGLPNELFAGGVYFEHIQNDGAVGRVEIGRSEFQHVNISAGGFGGDIGFHGAGGSSKGRAGNFGNGALKWR